MKRVELAALIRSEENSGVEFNRDDLRPERVAREIAALLNLEGGHVFLGVEDDGTVTGLSRDRRQAEEWVMEVARTHVRPATIPYWETVEWREGVIVGVVSLPADAPDKPYKAKRGSAWVTQVRVGTTTRDASDEEELRLYQQSGRLQYDRKPVPGTSFADLDRRRMINYFHDLRQQDSPEIGDQDAWTRLLVNTEILVESRGRSDGTRYPRQPRTFSESIEWFDSGVMERTLEFVRRNIGLKAWDRYRRTPAGALGVPSGGGTEAIVNAVAHRDYTITVSDIELSIFADRMEIVSPGRLPNTVTVAKMRAGYRATRNELVKEVLRDYRYVEATGLGVPRKIVRGMHEHYPEEKQLPKFDGNLLPHKQIALQTSA